MRRPNLSGALKFFMRHPIFIVGIAIACLLALSPYLLEIMQGDVPIVFYGQILDESEHGVPGVEVTMQVLATKRLAVPVPFAPNQTGWLVKTVTDKDGKFVVNDGRGTALIILSARKAGYSHDLYGPSRGDYTYSSGTAYVPRFTPNPSKPEVFHLRRVPGG